MEIRDFYEDLLGLASPWAVKTVAVKEESVDVYIECAETAQFPCPHCERSFPVCDYSPSKTWWHLDTCRKMTFLHAGLPIMDCPEHGKQHPRIPWAGEDSPVTRAFERWIVSLAEAFGDTKKAAHFAGVERFLIRRLLRRTASPHGRTAADPGSGLAPAGRLAESREQGIPVCGASPPEQISLFAQNMLFVNQGIQAFENMELEKAVDLFQKQRSLYPKGYNISSKLKAAEFLIQGMREAPGEPGEVPGYLCRLWDSFEDYARAEGMEREAFSARAKGSYFAHVLQEVGRAGLAGLGMLPEDIPVGFILLRAGRYKEAVRSLQECIVKMPGNAALYGWLGDAYLLRGEPAVARQCYREAFFIDPAAIDWRHLEDADLKQLKQDILLEYDFDSDLAQEWLPSHARIEGLFERRAVGLNDGLKEMVDDYLASEKAWSKEKTPHRAAKLFLRGMVLCENAENLKFIKKIDLIQVRRVMKQVNPDLFEEFLERVVGR